MPISNTRTTYCYTPYERAEIVDYINFEIIDQSGIYTRTLGDFIETGQTIKLKIPNTNNFFWIANYQKKSPYDGISRGGKNCYNTNYTFQSPYCNEGKGLYIFREGTNCYNFNEPFDVVSSEGKYNWTTSNYHNVPPQPCHFFTQGASNIPVFDMLIGQSNSRYFGKDKYRKAPTGSYVQILNDDLCSDNDNFYITWDDKGNGKNAFNMNYEEIFSPYSNPPTSCCTPDNTGITIKIENQNSSTGEISIKIFYDNNSTALLELPPSKPKNLKVGPNYINTVSFYPHLIWEQNIEPDFFSNGYYNVYRGISYTCETEPSYTFLASISPNTTEYIDYNVVLFNGTQGPQNCGNMKITYSYKISAIDNTNLESVKSERGFIRGYQIGCLVDPGSDSFSFEQPEKFYISNNYPNPFNPVTNFKYQIPYTAFVSIKIYDITGKEIATLVNEVKTPGTYIVSFNAADLATGIYYYNFRAGNRFNQTKKMLLLK